MIFTYFCSPGRSQFRVTTPLSPRTPKPNSSASSHAFESTTSRSSHCSTETDMFVRATNVFLIYRVYDPQERIERFLLQLESFVLKRRCVFIGRRVSLEVPIISDPLFGWYRRSALNENSSLRSPFLGAPPHAPVHAIPSSLGAALSPTTFQGTPPPPLPRRAGVHHDAVSLTRCPPKP